MNKKYDKVMEHIEVTPEMHQRILKNIQQVDLTKQKPAKVIQFLRWKQLATLAACLVVVLTGILTVPQLLNSESYYDSYIDLNQATDIVEVNTIDALSEEVGFYVNEMSRLPFQVENTKYTAYWEEMAEITYAGDGQTAVYRKGPGSKDISGDYNIYNSETEMSVNDYDVTLKGNGNVYLLAIWTDADYSYSLSLSDGKTESEWKTILSGEN
ncbi:MAG: hypothetical protein ACOX7J_01195 [Bacillota bacterium]